MDSKGLSEIQRIFNDSINLKKEIVADNQLLSVIEKVTNIVVQCFEKEGKVLLCGNGGSASDAQHIAAEFTGRFYLDREPFFAEALHVNTSFLTAVANDYSYSEIYSRSVKAKGKRGDVLIGLSTSGNSENIVKAFKVAKELGLITVGLTGETGGQMKNADYLINVPSNDTPRIQETHITIGHIICELVEKKIFTND